MSDTALKEMPPEAKQELENIVTMTKRGFDPVARLHNRGLRKATITLFLDDEKGVEIGWAYDVNNGLGQFIRREREGVVGKIEAAQQARQEAIDAYQETVQNAKVLETPAKELKAAKATMDSLVELADTTIAELTAEHDRLVAELTKSGFTVRLRALPPVIQKDCHRLARESLEIKGKHVPEEQQEKYDKAYAAHLMSKMIQSIIDNETGAVNTETTYQDAFEMIGWLPAGQYARLDRLMGKIQFTDAISQAIEGQEDFS